MPDFISIALRGVCPQICEILRFCDFLLSYPVLDILLFLGITPAATLGQILTVYGLNDDASPPKDVPFGSFNDD